MRINSLPLVSIGIITYNQKSYLKECIDSVLAQEYPNKEIIIADDCSTDGTVELLAEYQRNFPNLIKIVLSSKNKGITSNSNSALFECNGEYIALMGGDDVMFPTKISKQLEFMEAHPHVTICFHNMNLSEQENHIIHHCNPRLTKPKYRSVNKLIEVNFIPASSAFIRRSEMPKHGFDLRLPTVSDWLFFIELGMRGEIGYINEILGRYRKHPNSISHSYEKCLPDIFKTLSIIDAQWPKFIKNTKKARSILLADLGYRKMKIDEKKAGQKFLFDSLRLDYFNWKALSCFLISLFGTSAVKEIFKRREKSRVIKKI